MPRPTGDKNTGKELLVLEYVDNLRQQYSQLFPQRPLLFLTAINELGVEKFVCSTLRPTELPYTDLYEAETCAKFIADHIEYKPLDHPTELPENLPSPSHILSIQEGNCFDIAHILVSLLLGVGYDAYVVVGYAEKCVCECDLSGRKCSASVSTELDESGDEKTGEVRKSKYKIRCRPDLVSHFSQKQGEKMAEELKRMEDENKQVEEETEEEVEGDDTDPLYGKRIHAWVAVLKGKRMVKEDFFLEPTTGEKMSVEECSDRYFGVESLHNNTNFWINMQEIPTGIKEMKFDLNDLTDWEYVFIEREKSKEKDLSESELSTSVDVKKDVVEEEEEKKPVDEAGEMGDQVLSVTQSWVDHLVIPYEKFERKYPNGKKTVQYEDQSIEYYSPYVNPTGALLVMESVDKSSKVSLFGNRADKLRKREVFPVKKLYIEWFSPGKRGESQYEALRKLVVTTGERKEEFFYPDARTDGLLSRIEYFSGENFMNSGKYKKSVETYGGREDGLIMRKVLYDVEEEERQSIDMGRRKSRTVGQQESRYSVRIERPVSKITEIFSPQSMGSRVKSDEDVSFVELYPEGEHIEALDLKRNVKKRVFDKRLHTIRVIFHYAKDSIMNSVLVFKATGAELQGLDVDISIKDPFVEKPTELSLVDMYNTLQRIMKHVESDVREMEKSGEDRGNQRGLDEESIKTEVSVYDPIRNKLSEEEIRERKQQLEEEARKRALRDYLTPYLPPDYTEGGITVEIAVSAKESCLKALKERLIERATIIQKRLNEERSERAKRSAAFSRNEGTLDSEDASAAAFNEYEEEAAFRIHILEQRLQRHEEMAVERYAELENKLRNDPRLAPYLRD